MIRDGRAPSVLVQTLSAVIFQHYTPENNNFYKNTVQLSIFRVFCCYLGIIDVRDGRASSVLARTLPAVIFQHLTPEINNFYGNTIQ